MSPHLRDIFIIREATGGDPEILSWLDSKLSQRHLSSWPWQRDEKKMDIRSLVPGDDPDRESIVFFKNIPHITCSMFVMSSEAHRVASGRGRGGQGWMIDLEILSLASSNGSRVEDNFIYHTEFRVTDEEAAVRSAEKLRDFVDRQTLKDLLDIPRSGPLHMSKFQR